MIYFPRGIISTDTSAPSPTIVYEAETLNNCYALVRGRMSEESIIRSFWPTV